MIDINNYIVNENNNIDEEVDKIFQYYKISGFPNYTKDSYDIKKELNKLIKFDESRLLYNDNCLKQTMHSCGFLWTYFPHWIEIECGTSRSLIECWNDDDTLKQLIKKTYKYLLKHSDSKKWTTNRLRQNAKVYGAKQSVSNFRPTVAKYIYQNYGFAGKVWDMCSGFGGRLLGFLASNCTEYIGTDPSTKTFEGLTKLSTDYSYVGKNIKLFKLGCEEYCPPDNSIDLCFTSPPYFDTEKYSTELTQSYLKYPSPDEWINGFLKSMIYNTYKCTTKNGHCLINIANTKKVFNLESETIRLAKEIGYKHENTLKMELSSISGKGVKYEPIFIFKK